MDGAGLDADLEAGHLVGGGEGEVGVLGDEDSVGALVVVDGEVDLLVPLGGGGHSGDDGIDLTGLEGGDEAIEGDVLEFDLDAELVADLIDQDYVEAVKLVVLVDEFEGRIVRRCADDDLACGLNARPLVLLLRRGLGWRGGRCLGRGLGRWCLGRLGRLLARRQGDGDQHDDRHQGVYPVPRVLLHNSSP